MKSERSKVRTRAGVVAAGLVALAGVGIAHPTIGSTTPASVTLNYTCPFPLIGDQAVSVKISTDIPATLEVGKPSGQFNITAVATVGANATQGLNLVGAKTLEGSALADSGVASPDGNLALKVPTSLDKTDIPASGTFDITAHGTTPSLTFTNPGTVTITVSDLNLTLTPKDANGAATGLGTFDSHCVMTAGQNNVLAQRTIVPASTTTAPPTTAPPTTAPPTTAPPTTAPPTTAPPTTAPPTTAPPTTAPPTTAPPTTAPPTTAPPTTAPPAPIHLTYKVTGSSFIKAPNGTVPISGKIDVDFDLATGKYTGSLALNPSTADFKVFGMLPATAKIAFAQVGKTTGTFSGGKLIANNDITVKIPSISTFGIELGGGATCQTGTPAKINLASPAGATFDPFAGGKLSGTYTLPGLKGCGALNDILSLLTSGPGNTIDLTLTKA